MRSPLLTIRLEKGSCTKPSKNCKATLEAKEKRVKDLEDEIRSLKATKQNKTITDYFTKKS